MPPTIEGEERLQREAKHITNDNKDWVHYMSSVSRNRRISASRRIVMVIRGIQSTL